MASGPEGERSRRQREREALLAQAKSSDEKEESCKLLKDLRGEDTWMSADVNERVEPLEKEHSVQKKKKKDKHSKKAKKEKKKSKKHKSEKKDDLLDSSSESSVEWVESNVSQSDDTEEAWKVNEQPDAAKEPSLQREEWMNLNFMSLKTTSVAAVKGERHKEKVLERQKAQELEQAMLSERELNPYWKDGGTGLPPEKDEEGSVKKVTVVEDAGLSWLRKSYQRMKEQAEREKRNFEEIVAERYGSVEVFQSRLEEAEKAASKKENYHRSGRWKRTDYSESEEEKKDKKVQHVERVTRDEDDRNRHTFGGYSREKYGKGWAQEDKGYRRDVSRADQECRRSNMDSVLGGYSSKAEKYSSEKQNQEKSSSLSNLKHKFLKPSEDDLTSYSAPRDSKFKQTCSKEDSAHSSLSSRFQKPGEDTALWTKAHKEESNEKLKSDQKSSGTREQIDGKSWKRTPGDEKEKLQQEHAGDTPEKKEILSDNKSSSRSSKDEPPRVLSEEEMNRLGARIVKAELMGDTDLASELQAELDNARKLRETQGQIPAKAGRDASSRQEDEQVVLVRTDGSGRAWPVMGPAEPLEPKGGRRKPQMMPTHVDKERVRYFQDDDRMNLKDLVKNEKMRTAEDQNSLFMRMASKLMEKTDREYYTLDDMFVSKAAKRARSGEEEEVQRRKAIREHQQLAACMEKCPYCFDSSELSKHLIIAIGTKVYLSLPSSQSLTEGHCLIAPLQHHTAATLLDEDIWEEIQMFRNALVKMFEAKDLDCVFLETNMSMKKRYHMVYECIPLPKEVGDMAPIYFKKAIMESDEEWSMNKKLIDLSSKDIRKSVPKGLPYFSVDFGLQGGFAHVIEDQHNFPHYFGKEIIGGMLDLEPRLWRKGVRQNFEEQRKKVLQFAQWWKPYDFTKKKE
ncbi:CWF19-like protein 2 [Parus major]|uniref:CWF19-like protein 2 n=1 Tax=Parus major TaxID=9157 RepID=UPI0007713D93|nr:CWF19-like protein 2 [Parus major]